MRSAAKRLSGFCSLQLCMRLAVLLCLLAWCHGKQELPHSRLLQVSSKEGARARSKAEAESRSKTLVGFTKFTDSLVEQYGSGEPVAPINQDTKDAIDDIILYIDSFWEHATAQHQNDKDLADYCGGGSDSCDARCINSKKDVKQTLLSEVSAMNSSLGDFTSCIGDHYPGFLVNANHCKAWDLYRADDSNWPEAHIGCIQQKHLDDEYITTDDALKLEDMEDCLEDTHAWLGDVWEKFEPCKRAEEPLPCTIKAEAYEIDHCQHSQTLSQTCHSFDSCMEWCTAHCVQECAAIDIRAGARKADNETGERIKCLLKVLTDEEGKDKSTKLASCKATNYTTKAEYFNLACSVGSAQDDSHVQCDQANQPVSCSTEYVNNFKAKNELFGQSDRQTETTPHAGVWDSCGCHRCIVGADWLGEHHHSYTDNCPGSGISGADGFH